MVCAKIIVDYIGFVEDVLFKYPKKMVKKNKVIDIIRGILNLQRTFTNWKYHLVDKHHIPSSYMKKKVNEIRTKNPIKVAFIIYDIAKWKSEALYRLMLEHDRFEPVLVPVIAFGGNYVETYRQFKQCIEALDSKGYTYIPGQHCVDIEKLVNPDIVFYGEAWDIFEKEYQLYKGVRRHSLPCYVNYCTNNIAGRKYEDKPQVNLLWQFYVENDSVYSDVKKLLPKRCANRVVTGLPFQDDFLSAIQNHKDVWKIQNKSKKRIIWAPSHTIKSNIAQSYSQSNFLEIADDMLSLAAKYSEDIQWAFKPHPVLRRKLVAVWGQKRTDEYYDRWSSMENTQLEQGQYIDLFMGSDALIHDSMSFIVEYMYTSKPVFYIDNGGNTCELYNTQTKSAFDIHYKGSQIEEIESFINKTVIGGDDPLYGARENYKNRFLIPPHGKSASQNIINAILGIEDYKVE